MKCVTRLITFPGCVLQAVTLEMSWIYILHRSMSNNVTDQWDVSAECCCYNHLQNKPLCTSYQNSTRVCTTLYHFHTLSLMSISPSVYISSFDMSPQPIYCSILLLSSAFHPRMSIHKHHWTQFSLTSQQWLKYSPRFTESDGSLPCSQNLANGSYLKSDYTSPQPHAKRTYQIKYYSPIYV